MYLQDQLNQLKQQEQAENDLSDLSSEVKRLLDDADSILGNVKVKLGDPTAEKELAVVDLTPISENLAKVEELAKTIPEATPEVEQLRNRLNDAATEKEKLVDSVKKVSDFDKKAREVQAEIDSVKLNVAALWDKGPIELSERQNDRPEVLVSANCISFVSFTMLL